MLIVDTGSFTSLQVAKSMKSSYKYIQSKDVSWLIISTNQMTNDHIKEGIVHEDTRTENTK